jgi:hypothetical protein
LQHKTCSSAEGQRIADLVVETLEAIIEVKILLVKSIKNHLILSLNLHIKA